MAYQGRVHIIGDLAQEKSKKIVDLIPKSKIVYRGIRRPLWFKIEFEDTHEEKEYLSKIASFYNERVADEEILIAHGTQSSSSLCQILLDGNLKHIKDIINYGNLGIFEGDIALGGYAYWDHGWGVFVANLKTIQQNCLARSEKENYLIVPLNELKGILLPTQIVDIVKEEFPDYRNLIKGYRQFAEELRQTPP